LREAADLLEWQGANPFRVNAYRRAAVTVESLREDLSSLAARDGQRSLEALPGIGHGIAGAIREMLASGRWSQLERLRGNADPATLFTVVPGIGPQLARRIHDELGIESLEALEVAAHDGRLAGIAGMGPRRVQGVQAGLAAVLGRAALRGARSARASPAVADLLAVDAEYRARSSAGELRRIAPRRFNPKGRAWLPVMHANRAGWHFTALYSNTARAHELGRTRDWVVIFWYDHDHVEAQCTVVTESSGPLRGLRVVRGREAECAEHYGGTGLQKGAA
jgi:hypothetical protein